MFPIPQIEINIRFCLETSSFEHADCPYAVIDYPAPLSLSGLHQYQFITNHNFSDQSKLTNFVPKRQKPTLGTVTLTTLICWDCMYRPLYI